MKTFKTLTILLCILLPCVSLVSLSADKPKKEQGWKEWLREIAPIISPQERAVAKLLQTVEERKRFKDLFWQARDPSPHVPPNEYQVEYYQRLDYAKRRLGGVHTDRGQIYVIMGKPFDIDHFSGHENLVECEMWEYRSDGRFGLPPFMNIIFYKPHDMGEFQLYHPGIHRPQDLLSASAAGSVKSQFQAYREVKKNSTVLAQASLSILPGEGDPGEMSLSTSSFAMNKIYSLPEKEAETGYIRNFKTPTGSVEVKTTTNEIRGHIYAALTRNNGVDFLNFAVMPDVMNFKHTSENVYTADIDIHISAEDLSGRSIFQDVKKINLKIDTQRKQQIDKRKIAFMNFSPVIEGDFNVTIAYMNKTTDEFFTHKERITVSGDKPSVVLGFELKAAENRNYMPFAADKFLVLTDPRFTFNQKDTLEGIVWKAGAGADTGDPEVFLESITGKNKIKIEPLVQNNDHYRFRLPLSNVKDDNYLLTVKTPDSESPAITRKIHVLPFYINIERPVTMAKPEPPGAVNNYLFVQAQQYLNAGDTDRAAALFDKIPRGYWNAVTLPVIARAYYEKKDHARVLELLEREEVKKVYAVLIMLANSSIELKQYEKALQYLEQLRKYGDSVRINQLLAATCLSLGRREKAKQYYEHAKKLMKK